MQFQETTRGISHLSPFAEICIDHLRVIQQSGYESFLGSSQIRLQVFQKALSTSRDAESFPPIISYIIQAHLNIQ